MTWSDVLLITRGLPLTIFLTLASFATGAVLGIPLLLACRSSWRLVRASAQLFILIVRGIPPLVWIFTIFFGLGMGYLPLNPFTAAWMAFSLISAANLSEIYRGALVAVQHGQWEASSALGLGRWNIFRDIIGPQAFRVALPSAASYLIGLMKDTAIASTIGVAELTFYGNKVSQLTFRGLEVFSIVAALYIFLSIPIAWFSRVADKYLQAKVAR